MKFKPASRKGSVVIEVGPEEKSFPAMTRSEAAALPIFNLKRILTAVDFSDLSRKAAHYAAAFAKQFGAELTLLHVIEPYPFVPGMDPVETESIQEARRDLERLQAEMGTLSTCQPILRTGEPQLEIIRAAQELGVDLIILGTHGRSGLARVLLGGTAQKVVRHAGCPVLVVRENEQDFLVDKAFAVSEQTATKAP